MRPRRRPGPPATLGRARTAVTAGLTALVTLLSGCGGTPERTVGDPVTSAEAGVLGSVLTEGRTAGGADFVVSAPFADEAELTLTGEVDLQRSTGRAQAVTSYADGEADQVRTVFFTATDLWQGDVPGLADALEAQGLPAAGYARRPLVPLTDAGTAPLLDVLVQMLTRLGSDDPDPAGSFADYTWSGTRSVDGALTTVFRSGTGAEVAVAADTGLLVQYVTELQGFQVTITLADHGEREIRPPADADTVDTADHPELAGQLDL